MTERRIDAAGIRTAVIEGGEGGPLVILHGAAEFGAKWLPIIPALTRTHRVIVPDLPGHGASEAGEGKLDADRACAWLGELIERTCDSPPILMGSLLGGSIAARFAAARPDAVSRLVLTDSLGLGRFRPAPGFAFALARHSLRPTERSLAGLLGQCMVDTGRVREQFGSRWDALGAYALSGARAPEQKAAVKALMPKVGMPPIPPEELDRIAAPTTLIWGRQDRAVKLPVAERASERHGWPLHVIDEAGDDPALEQPEAFLDALYTALDGHERREAPMAMEAR